MAGNFLGFNFPFGASNVNNPTAQPANTPNNPNFPSSKQLEPKNSNNPQNTVQQNAGNNEPNTDPNTNADPSKGAQGSQLDAFKDLFKLPTDKDGNPLQPNDPLAAPVLSVNPEKLKEAAGKMNFMAGISQEQLTKAMSGQDPQAFMEVINQAAQGAFLSAMQLNANVVEGAFARNNQRFDQALPERIRNIQVKQTTFKNPALSHPAAAPLVESLKQSIAATNPHLSPAQVAENAENYVVAMMTDMQAANLPKDGKNKQGGSEMDWTAILTNNG